jgi:lauroyl/myristoyl acyltransferase
VLSKFIKGLALLTLFFPLRWIVRCFPYRQALKLGVLLGTAHAWLIHDQLYRQIYAGLCTVFRHELSEAHLRRLARHNLVTRYKHLIDSFFYQDLDEARIEQLAPIVRGRDHLDAVLAAGKGALLLATHFGSPGLLVAGLVFRGYRLHQVFTLTPQPHYRTWPWMERAIMQAKLQCWQHERVSFEFWRPGMYLRPLYRKLRENTVVILYGDGARGGHFTQVSFLGYPLWLSLGPFRIAARAQVPLIPAFIVRGAEGRHQIILESPLVLPDDKPASLAQGAHSYAALLSRYVRAYPDHWFTWARLRRRDADGTSLVMAAAEVERAHFYTPMGRQAT